MSTDPRKRVNLAVEICVLWNGGLEEVEHIPLSAGAAASFAIGEAFDCDFPVPIEDLEGSARFPLVEIDERGAVKLEVPPGAELNCGDTHVQDEPEQLTLEPGRRVEIGLGALSFEVEVVEMPEWASPRKNLNKIYSVAFTMSFLLHAGVAATFAMIPPAPDPLSFDDIVAKSRIARYMLLEPQGATSTDPPLWLERDRYDSRLAGGMPHRGEEGQMGNHYSVKSMAREYGVLSYLSTQESPTAPFGAEPESHLGGMIGNPAGGHYGIAGPAEHKLRGTGRGGGGTGEGTIGLRDPYVAPDGLSGVTADGRPYVVIGGEGDDTRNEADEAAAVERYERDGENPFEDASVRPLSTFAIDVDTASYTNARRFLAKGALPPKDAVRIEEMVNYFDYDYRPPSGRDPFAVNVEVADCPWRADHRLVRIGLKGREVGSRKPANLVFLIDTSGSMQARDKLPLLKDAMKLLVDQLGDKDRIAIVTYADVSGLALESTAVRERGTILRAIDDLQGGGGTNGGAGIKLAYRIADKHYVEGGVNRVLLATDGDFNVGTTGLDDLTALIERQATSNVFLTTLGFGTGNYNDALMERLADRGNGNYAYIDSLAEARKSLVDEVDGTVVTIAKDVKIQVEFNATQVEAYRLIGYENRRLAAQDFDDDWKDAGEIGAGHTVTALYEVVPYGTEFELPVDGETEFSEPAGTVSVMRDDQLLTLKLRYKEPEADDSERLVFNVFDRGATIDESSPDFRFAAAVAGFGMLLRDSQHRGEITVDQVIRLAESGLGRDMSGYREQFLELAERARTLGVGDRT
ncbi:MAG: VWA domain-containing protein [Deltaproteobacteria bacterium]|nr:VWA domain-containing protein [Deltaproteobacteria bacterium]